MTPVVSVDRDKNSGDGMDRAKTLKETLQASREKQSWTTVSDCNILRPLTTQGIMENVLYPFLVYYYVLYNSCIECIYY